jgi:hypothetical protein
LILLSKEKINWLHEPVFLTLKQSVSKGLWVLVKIPSSGYLILNSNSLRNQSAKATADLKVA